MSSECGSPDIATTLPISRRYPNLASNFRLLLSQQTLVEGPYVEALPDFEKGSSLESLLIKNGGFIHDALENLPTVARKLHMHQHRALELAVRDEKSLLVATGTGSGKTETFLYPIADRLLSDPEPEKPGVRALLIYPMNALANDQLYYRIAPLFGRFLRDYGITFGRYTGQIKAKVKRNEEETHLLGNSKLMHALGEPEKIPSNWLLTREEMLNNPPKILITNYAMLEHLLLLPRNERLFSTNALQIVVLDEIHTYHGAQATEVAFLLRKLKNRLSIEQPLQVFGTSASLSDGNDADEKLKVFATSLFGEDVHDVVRGKRVAHERLQSATKNEFSLSVAEWAALAGVLEKLLIQPDEDKTADTWNDLLDSNGLPNIHLKLQSGSVLAVLLEERFAANREVRQVAQLLDRGGIKNFRDLANLIFNSPTVVASDEQKYQALSTVIRIGTLARADENSFPLLPGRYHIAVNSIEGVALLPASNEEGWSKLKAARHYCDEDGQYFPLMTCRKCGQPYLEGFEEGGYLYNRRPHDRESHGERRVFWLGKPVGYVEDEDDEFEDDVPANYQEFWLDVKSGELTARDSSIVLYAVITERDEQEKAWYVKKCPACGGSAAGADAEIITRMHPGNEALGSVVTQRVLESLPPGLVDHYAPRPAMGRNLLSFSDNRQDAAFFAPYFERTAADIALRSAIRNVLKERTSPLGAPQLAEFIFQYWERDGQKAVLLDVNGDMCHDHQDILAILIGLLGAEFCTPGGRRNSVESLGVVNVTYDEQRLRLLTQKVKSFWPKALPSDDESVNSLIHIFLENIRRERALSKFHRVALSDEHVWGVYNGHRSFDIEGDDKNVKYKWLPAQHQKRHNRRSWYLMEQLGLAKEEAATFLRQFWEALVKPPAAFLERHPPGFSLNGDLIRFGNGDLVPLYVCNSCGLMQQYLVEKKCVAFKCKGDVKELSAEERMVMRRENHYLASYDETTHVTVRAREHTASLSTELREAIERDFAERKLNLLSCTTTMEMGVDLGDLEAVVNLNVPPGVANYQQRTGRAGRRAQAAPFCVTVARNSNFDQAVVRNFREYLGSSPGTPFIHLDNQELFKRHQFSVLLAHFLRQKITEKDINAPSMKHFFGEIFTKDTLRAFTEELLQWFEGLSGIAAMAEAKELIGRLPESVRTIGSYGAILRNQFLAELREFSEVVCERFSKYTEKMNEAATASDYKKASYWQKMREDFMGQFLINQLSQRGLIPTYSFPVHSLSLEVLSDTSRGYSSKSDVILSRDASLGISEYAPGAEVVANGRIWESAGLAYYPKAFMPERWYVACTECFHVDIGDTIEEVPPACGNCGSAEGRRKRLFIEPHGFITSSSDHRGRDPGTTRRKIKPADEAKLIAAPRDDLFEETGLSFLSSAFLSARSADANGLKGALFVANRGAYGEGYHRCSWCSYCEPVKPKKAQTRSASKKASSVTADAKLNHSDPQTGLKCKNDKVSRFGLDFVHRFDTDVRLFRFINPLPDPDRPDIEARRFHERLARTIAEAFRLAVTRLFELYPGELRAIFRLYGSRLEIVLYDAVPGGAGYCARIGESGYSFTAMVKETLNRLDCPAECESGCRVCLCDYSNQRYWDGFDRIAAMNWLKELLDPQGSSSEPGNYVRWPSPSLIALSERLANYEEISFVTRSFVDVGSFSEDSLSQLIYWLQNGTKINVYLSNKLDEKPKAQYPLSAYRRLHPYVIEGRLQIFEIPEKFTKNLEILPRIFVGTALHLPIVRQHFAVHSLLGGIISGSAEIGTVDEKVHTLLQELVNEAQPYSIEVLREGERMQMWTLEKGQLRNLDKIFAPINKMYVKKITIRDPYCATTSSINKLESFLRFIQAFTQTIESLSIRCRENRDKDGYVEFYLDVERRLDDLINRMGFNKREVEAVPLKGGGKSFHDRELDITVVSDDGCEECYRYFLTGGIDFLMDEKTETRVFCIRV
jgi:ATP-dependent helicase YprA (DUF1998 family)